MKTRNFITIMLALVISSPIVFGSEPAPVTESAATSTTVETKLSTEEMASLTKRVEEIRDMDKSGMTRIEKKELKNELKSTKENIRRSGGYVYIGTGTLILIILLIILL